MWRLNGIQNWHRNLPSRLGENVALIVKFVIDWRVKDELRDFFCQEGSSFELEILLLDAQTFVKENRRKFQSSLRHKRSQLKKIEI